MCPVFLDTRRCKLDTVKYCITAVRRTTIKDKTDTGKCAYNYDYEICIHLLLCHITHHNGNN